MQRALRANQSGISLALVRDKLPLILNELARKATHGYSKGAQGLSVRPQRPRIFTRNSISPSRRLRQRGSRYAIHAGRNLPVKEFRYLRTVRVTAAVYRGLCSARSRLAFAQWHRAGVRPYTSCFHFAESCVFSKQSLPPCLLRPPSLKGPPSSQSYWVNLPSSLSAVISSTFMY